MINFQTFIASSLALKEYRAAVSQAVTELDGEKYNCTFSYYDYTEHANQRQEKISAQEPVNRLIGESTFFIMIIDGVVGDKTIEEYRKATEFCRNHQYPVYISVFYKKTPSVTVAGENQCTFDDFQKRYIDKARFDDNPYASAQEKSILVKDKLVYAYPFDTAEDIKMKVTQEIKNWMASPYRPLMDAKMGRSFVPSDFYSDDARREHCVDGVYFKRDFDVDIKSALCGQKDVIYLYGASLSGKTRAVYQAATKIPQGWFYVMPPFDTLTDVLLSKINDITKYLEYAKLEQKLYLIFDDFNKYKLEDSAVSDALESLFMQVHKKECSVIITASVPIKDLPVAGLLEHVTKEKIEIPKMSPNEHVEAIQLFRRNGFTIKEQNTKYLTAGALLIDLDSKKRDYNSFLAKASGEVARIVRQNLLRSIKAFSIWHNSNMGDLDSMYVFCKYLHSRRCDENGKRLSLERDQFNFAQRALLSTCTGITDNSYTLKENSKKVNMLGIQEYVYRYFIDYSGEVMEDESMCTPEQELDLIYLILSFVYEQKQPLIIDLAKIITRCEHRKEVSKHLFDVFQEKVEPLEENNDWVARLLEEKAAIEQGIALDTFTEEVPLYYPKIFKQKIYDATDFEEAWEYFMMAKEGLRDMFMLGALYMRAKNPDEMRKVESLQEYECFGREPFFLYKRMQKIQTFSEGLEIVTQFRIKDEQTYIDYMMADEGPTQRRDQERFLFMFDLSWYRQALNRLFGLVSTEEEFELACYLLRMGYILCSDDKNVLMSYNADKGKYSKEKLSLIDVLSNVDTYALLGAFSRLYQNEARLMGDFIVEKLISVVQATLDLGWTPRYRIRIIIATVANAFIKQFDKSGYKEAFNEIFVHLKDDKTQMVFRDSYTYSTILDMVDCSLWEALNLFYYYIEPHSRDPHNFLLINHFILNRLLSKAKKEDDVAQIREINKMFDRYEVERDRYSYNMILESQPFKDGWHIVKTMLKRKMPLDQYTLCSLIKTADDIPTALGFFDKIDRLNIPDEVIVKRLFTEDRETRRIVAEMQLQSMASSQQYAWFCLFGKVCNGEIERKIIDNCLVYLENTPELSGLLKDGKLYNVCLSNQTYIRNYSEIMIFLVKHKNFVFDGYSLVHCIDILVREYTPKTRERVVADANELFRYARRNQVEISNIHYNNRMELFNSHLANDALPLVFFQDDGTEVVERCTPLQYVQSMVDYGILIDKHTIIALTKITGFMSDHILNAILELCREHSIKIDSKMGGIILEKYNSVMSANTMRQLDVLINDADPNLYNKQLIYKYGKCSITFDEAIRKVNTSSVTSSIAAYNAIMVKFDKKENSNKKQISNAERQLNFQTAWNVYKKYILEFSRPISDTFSILSGMAVTLDDLNKIVFEINWLNSEKQYKLSISSYILTAYLRIATSVEELRSYVQAHEHRGGEVASCNTDILLRQLVQMANQSDNEALKYVEQIIDYIFNRPSMEPVAFSELPLVKNYREKSFVSELTIVNILYLRNIENYIKYEKIIEVIIELYPHLFTERNGIAEYLGKRNMAIFKFIPIFDLLNKQTDSAVMKFRCDMLSNLIRNRWATAKKNPLTYTDFKKMVEVWAVGKYTHEQWNRIAVDMIMLLRNLSQTGQGDSSRFKTIINGIYNKSYMGKLNIGDFMLPQDAIPGPFEFSIKDNTLETLQYFNSILEYRINGIERKNSKDNDIEIIDEISRFQRRHNLHSKTFRRICKNGIKKYSSLKKLVPLVNSSPECFIVLLTQMASRLYGYDKMVQTLKIALKYNIDLREEFMSNLARSVMSCRHEDVTMKKVHAQILYGLRTDNLRGYHFVAGDDAMLPNLNRPIQIYPDVRNLLLLCSDIYNSNNPEESCKRIVEYCKADREDQRKRDEEKENPLIDTTFVNTLLSLYAKLSRKERKNVKKEQKESWIELIKSIYHSDNLEKVDVSPLFQCPSALEELRQMGIEFIIPQKYLDYTILQYLEIPLQEKIDLILASHSLNYWLKSYENSEDILVLLPYIQEQSPQNVKYVITAALEKVEKLETFMVILQAMDEDEECFRYTPCEKQLFIKLMYFLLANYDLYLRLYRTRLDLLNPFKFSLLNKLFVGLNLKNSTEIQIPEKQVVQFQQLYAENSLLGSIVNMTDMYKVYDKLKSYVNDGGMITSDFLITKLLKVNDVRILIIQDICVNGEFNLYYLATLRIPKEAFRAKMSSEILNSLFSALNDPKLAAGITKLDLFHHAIESFGSSYISNQNLITVILSIKNVEDYKRFMEEVRVREFELTEEHWCKLVVLLKTLSNRFDIPNTDIIRQVYSRVATNAEVNSLVYGHFCCAEFKDIVFDTWGATPVDAESVLKVIGKRTLVEKICRNMYMLPDQYLKSLIILQNYKRENPEGVTEKSVAEKIRTYEMYYMNRVSGGEVNFWELRRIAQFWARSGWIPQTKVLSAIFRYYKSLSCGDITPTDCENPEAIRKVALQNIVVLRRRLEYAEQKGFSKVRIYMKDLSERVSKAAENISMEYPLDKLKAILS